MLKRIIIFLFILIIVLSSIASMHIEKHYRQIKFNNINKYDYIILSNNKYKYNSYSYYANDSKFFLKDNKKINALVLMELENEYNDYAVISKNNVVKGEYKILDNNELAVSQNIANRFKLKINDAIYFDNISTGKKEEYTIKYIFSDAYGIFEADVDNNFGIILMGFNKEYYKNIKSDIIISADDFKPILQSIYANDIYKKNTNYFLYSAYIILFIFFILFLYSFLYLFIFNIYRKRKYIVYIICGLKKYLITFYVLRDFILLSMFPAIFIIFVLSIANIIINNYISIFTILFIFSILIIPTLIISIIQIFILKKI